MATQTLKTSKRAQLASLRAQIVQFQNDAPVSMTENEIAVAIQNLHTSMEEILANPLSYKNSGVVKHDGLETITEPVATPEPVVEPAALPTLTPKEIDGVHLIVGNQFSDGTLDCSPWSWSVCDGSKSMAGVLASLKDKGIVDFGDSEGKGRHRDQYVVLTELGKAVYPTLPLYTAPAEGIAIVAHTAKAPQATEGQKLALKRQGNGKTLKQNLLETIIGCDSVEQAGSYLRGYKSESLLAYWEASSDSRKKVLFRESRRAK